MRFPSFYFQVYDYKQDSISYGVAIFSVPIGDVLCNVLFLWQANQRTSIGLVKENDNVAMW